MAQKYKTGDIVQLKSGGPKMTVKTYGPGENIFCQWFAGAKLEGGNFHEDAIQPYVEEEKKK